MRAPTPIPWVENPKGQYPLPINSFYAFPRVPQAFFRLPLVPVINLIVYP